MQNVSVISGIRGQDGSLLADQLLNAGHKVYGFIRRSSQGLDLGNAKHLEGHPDLEIVEGDLTDLSSLQKLVNLAAPNYFYNAAAQSHVGSSFDQPTYTAQSTGLGVLNCLEAIRLSRYHTRFLQFSTSEMYGGLTDSSANEQTPFYPRSPYGCAKLFGYWTTINYRETYKMFATNAIMFNHESERRGPNFVTRKITLGISAIKQGKQSKLYLGNLEAKRDWGYAPDFMKGVQLIMEAKAPGDYVLATGETHTVREFCEIAFAHAGLGDYKDYVIIDPQFYRPCEVHTLIGDATKIKQELGWEPKTKFKELVKLMVDFDLNNHL